MTLSFLPGSKNFCQLLWVSCEVFVLHGYAWNHWVAKSCTTTAYRWLFRDSQLSLRTLWSAVIKSPKFSARGTAPPLRLLHGLLQFLSSGRSRNFGLQENEYKTLCLPKSSRLVNMGQIFPEFLQPFWDLRIQRVTPFYRSFLFICFWNFIGLDFLRLPRSIDTGTAEMSRLDASSRSRTDISPTVGEEGEDEEDEEEEEWLSGFIGVLKVDEDPEDELDKPGTTIGTKFSVLQGIRIPFKNEMWFLTTKPFVGIPVFIAKLSKR